MVRRARILRKLRADLDDFNADRRRDLGLVLDVHPGDMMRNLNIHSSEPRGFTDVRQELFGWTDDVSLNAEGWEYLHRGIAYEDRVFKEIDAAVKAAARKKEDG